MQNQEYIDKLFIEFNRDNPHVGNLPYIDKAFVNDMISVFEDIAEKCNVIKPVPTVEFKVHNTWVKGNITEVNLKYVEVETTDDITVNHIVRQKEDLVDILGASYINDNGNLVFQINNMNNIRIL